MHIICAPTVQTEEKRSKRNKSDAADDTVFIARRARLYFAADKIIFAASELQILVNDPPTILRPSDDSVGCLGDDYCPPQCNCAGSVVRCSRSQLTEIPRGIPPETTELYLDVNDIKTIQPERLNHLRILTRL